jgi:hypothetical protein
MSAVHVRHPGGREPERRYVLGVVLGDLLGLEWTAQAEERTDVAISPAGAPPGDDVLLPDGLLGAPAELWLAPASIPQSLPVPGSGRALGDLFGAAFFLLTRYEEIALPARDGHDRFPAGASLAGRQGMLERPLVNEYGEALWQALSARWPRLERRRRSYRLLLSHDVDQARSYPWGPLTLAKLAASDVLKRRDPDLAVRRLRAARSRHAPEPVHDLFDTFDLLMDSSERRGLRSAFYFLAGSSHPAFDGDYRLEDPWLGHLLRRIHERGHEIGLHPSYESYRDPERIRRELDSLQTACARLGIVQERWGGRQHFLRWENPTTWRAWEDAGLDYDSSLGFADAPGFRCGACFEFPVFDLPARRVLRLRERPLVLMEAALLNHGASRETVFAMASTLAARCRRVQGDFTFLWHNSRLESRRDQRLYQRALDAAAPGA